MTRASAVLAAALPLLALPAAGAAPEAQGLAAFGWFAELAGSCWKAEHPDGKTRDTQCYEAQYGKFVAGSIAVESAGPGGERQGFEGRALFAWDASARKIAYWQWSSTGAWSAGEAFREGERYRWPHPSRADPAKVTQRSIWTRLDADSFRVAREKLEGETWKEQFAVTYRRSPK